MKLIRFCLLWCCLFGGLPAGLADPVVLEDHRQGVSLSEAGQLLWQLDTTGTLGLDEVRDPAHAARFSVAPHPLRNGSDARPRWLKVELHQRGPHGDWVLATQTTALKDVRFHGPYDAAGRALAESVHTGLSQPFATRPLGSERYVFRLRLPAPGTYTVYVRLVSETSQNLDLTTWETAEYLQWRQHKRLFDGLCYGILFALLLYNLVLTVVFRDRTYAFYVGQCTFALLTLASFNGHAAHYLWGDWPWWQERGNVVLPGLWLCFGALFARSFLGTRAVSWLDRPLLAAAALAMVGALLGLSGQFGAAQAFNEVIASAGALLATGAAIVVTRRGFTPALWYLGGQALLFLSALGVVLVNWKLVEAPFLLANGLQIGIAGEMVVFAIALSSRIRGMRASQLELRLRAANLAEAAATDPLTGLANRAGLAQGAARLLDDGAPHALMLLDLDRFKPINDEHGHDAGDAVLRAVAERLQAQMRAGDIVARLGGDEFVILLAGQLPDERLAVLAQRLEGAVQQPVTFHGRSLGVAVSIGIARSPQDGRTLVELMRCADQAMYQAKQARAGHAFYGEAAAPA